MKPPTGLIFDLDGVLVDTADLHLSAWRSAAAEAGLDLSVFDSIDLRGVRRDQCLRLISRGRVISQSDGLAIMSAKDELYRCAVAKRGRQIRVEGVDELLRTLRSHGYRTGVASASRNAQLLMRNAAITDLADHVCDGHFDGPPKPAPDQFLAVARLLDIEPGRCLVFEDSNAGVDGAHAAGMAIVGIGPAVFGRNELCGWLQSLRGVTFQRVMELRPFASLSEKSQAFDSATPD